MKIFKTELPDLLKLPIDEQIEILKTESFEDYIIEIEIHKGGAEVPEDKIVVTYNNGDEYWVYLSQLNKVVYHIKKETAYEEIYTILKLSLIKFL